MSHAPKMETRHYRNLLVMSALSFVSMYVLMYAMIYTFSSVYANANQFLRFAGLTGDGQFIRGKRTANFAHARVS